MQISESFPLIFEQRNLLIEHLNGSLILLVLGLVLLLNFRQLFEVLFSDSDLGLGLL